MFILVVFFSSGVWYYGFEILQKGTVVLFSLVQLTRHEQSEQWD